METETVSAEVAKRLFWPNPMEQAILLACAADPQHTTWSAAAMAARPSVAEAGVTTATVERAVRNALRRLVDVGLVCRGARGEYALDINVYMSCKLAPTLIQGKFIAYYRRRKKATQAALAATAKMTRGRLSHLETGRRRATIVEHLHLLAALGIPDAGVYPTDRMLARGRALGVC